MAGQTSQRLTGVEGGVARLVAETKRQDRRMAQLWNTAMSQKRMGDVLGCVFAFPALRGCWLMSNFGEAGHVIDRAGQGRTLTNNNVTFCLENFLPYASFNGTTGYLERADEAGLDILGNESHVEPPIRGLTLGAVVYFENAASDYEVVLAKGAGAVGDTAYWLDRDDSGYGRFVVGDGAAFQGPSSTVAVGAQTWVSFIGRFDPSTELALWVDDVKYTDTVGVPATLTNVAEALNIGSYDGGSGYFMDGRVALAWLCAANVSDAVLMKYYGRLKPFLG